MYSEDYTAVPWPLARGATIISARSALPTPLSATACKFLRPLNLATTNTNAMKQQTRNDGGGFHHATYADDLGTISYMSLLLSACPHSQ